jgi:hypothetical protein
VVEFQFENVGSIMAFHTLTEVEVVGSIRYFSRNGVRANDAMTKFCTCMVAKQQAGSTKPDVIVFCQFNILRTTVLIYVTW